MDSLHHARQIERVAALSEAADGTAPLDEATLMALRHPERFRSWVEGEAVAVLVDDQVSLVVAPEARGRGLGSKLLDQLLGDVGPGTRLEAWSHADHPAARHLAGRTGFERVRELWVMRRRTSIPLPRLDPPPGVRLRTYTDDDAEAVLRLNAAAFAAHPEQGAMDADNLAERMAEHWFDPAGLILAVDTSEGAEGRLLAFHWTKQHSRELGEVYVVGVDPEAQGAGLGRLVTLAGLHHLADLQVNEVLLYVESDNAAAIRVYRDKLGFTHASEDTHVMYRRPA
ncbi:mycothiol acetyltransferase [Nocardioides sp. OK12]|uniref:Mycothiol acetyltransferase n=1 Tax=Nocardioides marinisabuli TaxID=419476 RepID=A0A7Y9JPZ1_9ACTN|nr:MULTISPECIES: mycothiol synthase [Nocardioides]NYD57532.1 mycothiol synthase [Nocardioides marinisabuli]GHJ58644.1 mycothiol acetyltransferase [Nocardioides sp. OK12]